jgi:hypothetical protein
MKKNQTRKKRLEIRWVEHKENIRQGRSNAERGNKVLAVNTLKDIGEETKREQAAGKNGKDVNQRKRERPKSELR